MTGDIVLQKDLSALLLAIGVAHQFLNRFSRFCLTCLQKRIVHQGEASWQALESPNRGVAQSGSASGLGPEGRRFESYRPDH